MLLTGLTLHLQNYEMYIVGNALPVIVTKLGEITSRTRILWVDIFAFVGHTLIM